MAVAENLEILSQLVVFLRFCQLNIYLSVYKEREREREREGRRMEGSVEGFSHGTMKVSRQTD